MLKYLFLIVVAVFSLPESSYGEPYDFEKNGIDYVWEYEPNFTESKKAFVDSFVKCYDPVRSDLNQPSRESLTKWLNDAFDKIYASFKKSEDLWLSAKVNGKIIGFLIIDVENYPEEIYLAQLAIAPSHQGKGIASTLIRSLYDQFSDCERFVAIIRHVNEEAKDFYKALGFVPSTNMRQGYSRELYTGFEFINPQEDLKHD